MYFKKCSVILKAEGEEVEGGGGGRERVFHLCVHSPNAFNRFEPGIWNPTQVSHACVRDSSTGAIIYCLQESGLEEPGTAMWHVVVPSVGLIQCPGLRIISL